MGLSRRGITWLPSSVRVDFGYALDLIQQGQMPQSAKTLKGFGGAVIELRENFNTNAFRAALTVRFDEVVDLLHVP